MTTMSAFGSELVEPNRAVAVLRATAARHGVDIHPVSDFDAVVAVIAVDVWMRSLNILDLSRSNAAGKGPLTVLSAALLRAAGHGNDGEGVHGSVSTARMRLNPIDTDHLAALMAWARGLGMDPAEVADNVGELLRRSTNVRLECAADLLDAAACH